MLTKKQKVLFELVKPKSLSEKEFLDLMTAFGLCGYAVKLVETESDRFKKLKLIDATVEVSREVIKEHVRLLEFFRRLKRLGEVGRGLGKGK